MQLSEIFGKSIVSIGSAKTLGVVKGVYIDPETYSVAGISTDEDMYMLPWDSIYAVNDILTTADTGLTSAKGTYIHINIGAYVYTARGKAAGKVEDVFVNSKRKSVKTDAGSLSLKKIGAASGNTVILSAAAKKPLPAARLLPALDGFVPGKASVSDKNGYGFLVGKKVAREVSDIGRSFVLMAGTIITDNIVKNALKAGKIADLVATSSD